MKQITILFISILFANYSNATIRRCNNSNAVQGTYTTAQAAHDAANPGDTIHLEPTFLGSYGTLTITKQIVVISTGDFINQNPSIQYSSNIGYCDIIYIQIGGENSVISCKVASPIYVDASNILITNSHYAGIYFGSYNSNPLASIIISKCIIDGVVQMNVSSTDLIITNNYIGSFYFAASNSSATIAYNVIGNLGYPMIENSIVANNIFISNYAYSFPNSNVSNNISIGASELPGGNGNINGVDMSTVFTNWGAFNGDNYQLNPSYSNQNLGMFAGPDPYKLATTPAIPSIYQLTVPASAVGNNLNISVSTKSNN